jgi:hypothetical protein
MKKLPTYLFALLIILSLVACKRDSSGPCGGGKEYYYLSEGEKAKVAYTGSDTIIFISNKNDTSICICQGKKQFFLSESVPVAGGDCDPRTIFYEAFNYKFISNKADFNLELNIYENDGYGSEAIHIIFNQSDFSIYTDRIDNSKAPHYIDSLLIRGNWYKGVTSTSKYFDPKLDKLYYNKEFGVLKIQNSDSTEVCELLTRK